ncbi:FKBP-type peptidyl-prolyl cis-trans isomerase [Segatella maculosa]|uniref:FKBP-type peptidyl-prolyl cis-trans isomerase n=1 Tax=Segatella maculosa TaxID=439703 RepID=UPI0028D1818C|nr:FKBP-type peptidyl-prolyl cis-trans isomerase [Segatella maculosa]
MRKIIMLTLVILAGVTLHTQAKDKNKKPNTAVQQPTVKFVSPSDTVSYIAGMAATEGLLPYLQQGFGVDAEHMADVIRGFEEAQTHIDDPAFKAYAAGMQIANKVNSSILPNMKQAFEGSADSIRQAMFIKGFIAALQNDTTFFAQSEASKLYRQRAEQVVETRNAAYKKENEDWLKANAKKEGMQTTPSGLQYKVLVAGNGPKPKATDKVKVKYEGRMIDGTVFDSSYKRDPQTNSFRCNEVIKGWTEALTMMPVGSKWEICIPQELAYGARQAGQIKPYSTLVFTVELLEIEK